MLLCEGLAASILFVCLWHADLLFLKQGNWIGSWNTANDLDAVLKENEICTQINQTYTISTETCKLWNHTKLSLLSSQNKINEI